MSTEHTRDVVVPVPSVLRGDEPLLDGTVADFWSWVLSDLRSNTVRPMLAEYLVSRALRGVGACRVEWDSCDVVTDSGLRVEVKSGGYLQSWRSTPSSEIRFGGLKARLWSPPNAYADVETFNADVYVFAVETERDPGSYNPLDIGQWSFWVSGVDALKALGAKSISLATMTRISTGPVSWHDLDDAVASICAHADDGVSRDGFEPPTNCL